MHGTGRTRLITPGFARVGPQVALLYLLTWSKQCLLYSDQQKVGPPPAKVRNTPAAMAPARTLRRLESPPRDCKLEYTGGNSLPHWLEASGGHFCQEALWIQKIPGVTQPGVFVTHNTTARV